jgi:hypothetical protein
MLLCMYLPALLMILVRPNVGESIGRLESAIRQVPAWIRGHGNTGE